MNAPRELPRAGAVFVNPRGCALRIISVDPPAYNDPANPEYWQIAYRTTYAYDGHTDDPSCHIWTTVQLLLNAGDYREVA